LYAYYLLTRNWRRPSAFSSDYYIFVITTVLRYVSRRLLIVKFTYARLPTLFKRLVSLSIHPRRISTVWFLFRCGYYYVSLASQIHTHTYYYIYSSECPIFRFLYNCVHYFVSWLADQIIVFKINLSDTWNEKHMGYSQILTCANLSIYVILDERNFIS